jgi:hypothetical protein
LRLQNLRAGETTEQIKLFNWAKMYEDIIPPLRLLYHVPNEGKRSTAGGQILKAAGLKSGVPDVCLPVARKGYNALYIEMKYGKNKPTAAQKDFMKALQDEGAKVAVCYSAEEAREMIRFYLSPAEGFNLVNCEEAIRTVDGCEGYGLDFAPCDKCKQHKAKGE